MRPPPPRAEWAYFFDIDGTLAELAATPAQARVSPGLRERFATLQQASGGAVAVVSGRALDDIDGLLGRELPAAGQHGAERRDARGRVHRVNGVVPRGIHRARAAVIGAIALHPGLLLEEKGRALALHYRGAPQLAAYAHRVMRAQREQLGARFALQRGKYVVELLPAGVDKGEAIRAFLREPPFRGRLPVFLGDDVTDEAGFAVVAASGGHAIKVGGGASSARYRLPSVRAVGVWLSTGVLATPHADHRRTR